MYAVGLEHQHAVENLKSDNEDFLIHVNTTIHSGDIPSIKDLLKECTERQVKTSVMDLRTALMDIFQKCANQVIQYLEHKELNLAFEQLPKLFESKSLILGVLPEIMRSFVGVKDRFINFFKAGARASQCGGTPDNVLSAVENQFATLETFVRFRVGNPKYYDEEFALDLQRPMEEYHKQLRAYFENVSSVYITELGNMNPPALKEALENIKMTSPLLKSVKCYANTDACEFRNELEALNECSSYEDAKNEVSEHIKKWEDVITCPLHDESRALAVHRDDFFKELNTKLSRLLHIDMLADHCNTDTVKVTGMYSSLVGLLEDRLRLLAKFCVELVQAVNVPIDGFKRFESHFDSLRSFSEHVDGKLGDCAKTLMSQTMRTLKEIVNSISSALVQETKPSLIVEGLCRVKLIANNISALKTETNQNIDVILNSYKKKKEGAEFIASIAILLNADDCGVGQCIIKVSTRHG